MVWGVCRLESLLRGQLFVVKEHLNRLPILIDPLSADEARPPKNFIDPIRNPSRTVRPTPASAPGLRGNLKHLSPCSFAA